ncbi:MAG: ABC transporter substrate-binding protein [Spirochaetales bacterium]|nr:ABC transporter substrate-binding protein [Spirochaetales bacterium]
MRRIHAFVLSLFFVSGALAPAVFAIGSRESASAAYPAPLRSLELRYTSGFSVDYFDGFKVVTVRAPWPGATESFRYVLHTRGTPRPSDPRLSGASFIETPVRSVATFSTSYLPAIIAIGKAETVVGVDSAAFVYSPEIRARVDSGKAVEVTRNWMPDVERLIALKPDAVFTYGMGNEWDTHPKLLEAGLPVILNGEWNETDPLGRAEWVKFIAAFYDEEAKATALFDRIAADYLDVKTRVAAARTPRPAVLVNGPFQGTWTVSGGQSFMARLVADAGGAYLWSDDPGTGGLTLSVEAVFERARKANVWLNPALMPTTIREVVALDPRFAELPVVDSGAVWNNNRKINESGGNDYFENAVLRPDLVLVDLAKILHPELFADRDFTWYRKMTE